jgi:hypothetical protein
MYRSKDKNYIVISIDAEKVFEKNQHHFMIKALKKLGIEGMYLNIKRLYITNLLTTSYYTENLKPFPLKSGTRQGCPPFPLLLNIVLEFLSRAIRQKEEIKEIKIGKEQVKLSLFADDMILIPKRPRKHHQKLIDIINTFSKVAEYKINIQKPVAFLYYGQAEKELRETIPFTMPQKYLEINLIKKVKDFLNKNYNSLKKEIRGDQKMEGHPISWISRINTVK